MAEEKQTKKRTTTKKTEEVKVEKKFCTKCGKELTKGETCSCETTNVAPVTINSDALLNTVKSTFTTINNVYKKPDTTIKEEVAKKESTFSTIIIISLAVSFAFYLMAMISAAADTASNLTSGLTNVVTNDIPYFKVFIYGILMYAIMAVIPMFAAFLVGKITRNNNFTFKRAFKLYTTSCAPLIYAYLGMAVIMLINVSLLNTLGLIAMGIISAFCFFNFILGFNKETEIRDDRRSWAVTSIIAVWIAITIIAALLIFGSVLSDTTKGITSNNNYNNSFKW